MSDEEDKPEEAGGLPGWVMTFADLMSLLMCFFVLLLSFSEMDVQKFKQLAGSMKNAFGVQKSVNVKDIPSGTSIIAREFSPGKPVPTSINEMRQQTTDDIKRTLDFTDSEFKGKQDLEVDALEKKDEGEQEGIGDQGTSNYQGVDEEGDSFFEGEDEKGKMAVGEETEEEVEKAKELVEQQLKEKIENEAGAIRAELEEELADGLVEVEVIDDEVLIRIREKGSFPSGNADIRKSFYPIMNKIGAMLNQTVKGRVVVAGHTDNVPIFTSQYPSNWVLSAARAANVVHYLSKYSKVPHERMEIRAHAETKPLMLNDSYENKARNRRVEIIVKYDESDLSGDEFLSSSSELNTVSIENKDEILMPNIEATEKLENTPEAENSPDVNEAPKPDVLEDALSSISETKQSNGIKNAEKVKITESKPEQTEVSETNKLSTEQEIKALEELLKKINKTNGKTQ